MVAGKGSFERATQVILLQVRRCAKLPGFPRRPMLRPWRQPPVTPQGLSLSLLPLLVVSVHRRWPGPCSPAGCPGALSGRTPLPLGWVRNVPATVVHLSSPMCIFPSAAPQDATPVTRRSLSHSLRASLAT